MSSNVTVQKNSEKLNESQKARTGKEDGLQRITSVSKNLKNNMENALNEIKKINQNTSTLATNAKIEANRAGDSGQSFLIVSNSIDVLSGKTNSAIESMKTKTISKMDELSKIIQKQSLNIKGNRLCNLALTNIGLLDKNLYERTADIRWWATDNLLVDSLKEKSDDAFFEASQRLNIILKSYTVYHELILCDMEGNAVASGMNDIFHMTGRNFANKEWFQSAINTVNGNDYGFQGVHHSPSINNDFTIVYSCKVHQDGDPFKKPVGVLAAVFKWTDLAQTVVNETHLTDDEKNESRVCIIDKDGNVLADTYNKMLEEKINFDNSRKFLESEKDFTVSFFEGKPCLIAHAKSPGFETYRSNWNCIVIQKLKDKSLIEVSQRKNETQGGADSLEGVAQLVENLSEETNSAIEKIQNINEETHILALNASIEAARAGNDGKGFGVIAEFMGTLSSQTSEMTKKMATENHDEIADLRETLSTHAEKVRGEKLSNMAMTNVDLIDRNLYERTADVRWWATEKSLANALKEKSLESTSFVTSRLEIILKNYTLYDDLVVCDLSGKVVANGNQSNHEIIGSMINNEDWFKEAIKTSNGKQFGFESVHKNNNDNQQYSVVYSCKIHEDGNIAKPAIGVLGVVFNWSNFSQTIFSETPLSEQEKTKTRICIANDEGLILADSNKEYLHETLDPEWRKELYSQEKNSQNFGKDGKTFCVGHALAPGYEGYSTGWHSVIIQEI